jgi:hypothetical protein
MAILKRVNRSIALILLLVFGLGLPAFGQVSREYQLKAVFLFNFAQFTEWPTNAFASPDSPLVIGILGNDPFGPYLDETVKNETVHGRKIVVERFRRLEEIQTCHILYIGELEERHLDSIVRELKGKPVLTVSDIPNAAIRGVIIRFLTERNKIRFRINVDSMKEAGVTISSKLLRAAEIVPSERK